MTVRRVLLVSDYSGSRGGCERLVEQLRAGLVERGVEARTLASQLGRRPGDREPDYIFRGTEGRARALPEIYNPSAVTALRHALADFDPDVVHVRMFMTQCSPGILQPLADRRVIYTAETYRTICPTGTRMVPAGEGCDALPGWACLRSGCFSLKGWIPRMAQMSMLRRNSTVLDHRVAPSATMAAELRKWGWRVDEVVSPGVPHYDRIQPLPTDTVIGFAGRFVPEKGIATLFRAFVRILAYRPDARLILAGDGPELPAMKRLATELEIAGAVDFAGFVPPSELMHRFERLAVQVVPSEWPEPFGLVTIEAMMRGTPVVATDIGASSELVADGKTGRLVSPFQAELLAFAILDTLDAPDRAAAWAEQARAQVLAANASSSVIERYLAIYGKLAARSAGAHRRAA